MYIHIQTQAAAIASAAVAGIILFSTDTYFQETPERKFLQVLIRSDQNTLLFW